MNISSAELFSEIDLHMLHKSTKQIRIYIRHSVKNTSSQSTLNIKQFAYKARLQNYKKRKKRRTTNKMKEQDEDEGVR